MTIALPIVLDANVVGGLYMMIRNEMRARHMSTSALAKRVNPANNRLGERLREGNLRPNELVKCMQLLDIDVCRAVYTILFLRDAEAYKNAMTGTLFEVTRQLAIVLPQLAEDEGVEIEQLPPALCKSVAVKCAKGLVSHHVTIAKARDALTLAA